MKITVLRFAPLFGPGVRTFYTAIFDHRLVPVLMGYDPLVQLLHPDDALAAFLAAVDAARPGAFNIVPSPAHPAARPRCTWRPRCRCPSRIRSRTRPRTCCGRRGSPTRPAAFVDFVRYPFLGDGEKARRELGFTARHSSRDALEAYLRYRHPRARARTAAEAGA